jgi:RNA polymerase sigma-70 factor (ECF subfamily)
VEGSDRERAEALYERYRPLVLRYLVLHTRNPDLADDLTQDVFTAVVASLPRVPRDNPLPWLYTVARRRLIDYIRTTRTSRRATAPLDENVAVREGDGAPGAVEAVVVAVEALPATQRVVFLEHVFEGRPFAEIAEHVHATEEACRMRFFRALAAVQASLRDNGFDV